MEEGENAGSSNKSTLDVSVRNPVTHNTWDKGRYTSFEIVVNTTNKSFCLSSSKTRRRFSEFEWLRKTLKHHHPLVTPPTLPPKKFFEDRFDPNFIAFRMKGLEDFLSKLVEEKYYLSDTTFHLFLQTNLTIKEIKEYIEGHMTTYPLDSLWKANGIKENCRDLSLESCSNKTDSSEFAGLYTEEDNDWSKVQHDEKRTADNLGAPSLSEETRDSHNSDISSSFSDSEEGLTEFPSLSLVNNPSLPTDSSHSSTSEKWHSPELSRKKSQTADKWHSPELSLEKSQTADNWHSPELSRKKLQTVDKDSVMEEVPPSELCSWKEKMPSTEEYHFKEGNNSQELSSQKSLSVHTERDSFSSHSPGKSSYTNHKPDSSFNVLNENNFDNIDIKSDVNDSDSNFIPNIQVDSVSNYTVSDQFSINKS